MRNDEDAKHIWFTSDMHLLHPKIVGICERPTTVEDHDQWLIDRFNSIVNKKDELYLLGDISMANKIATEKLLQKINGIKHLIPGNHDNSIDTSTYFKYIHNNIHDFNFNSPSYPNLHLVLCHYPLASWNRKIFGSGHLYGHVHGRLPGIGLSFDVGVDANDYLPLNLEQIYDKLTKISLSLM
jgi:calcineurin-like phosphoesterase family protein